MRDSATVSPRHQHQLATQYTEAKSRKLGFHMDFNRRSGCVCVWVLMLMYVTPKHYCTQLPPIEKFIYVVAPFGKALVNGNTPHYKLERFVAREASCPLIGLAAVI